MSIHQNKKLTTHPLELPEILIRIGHYIPHWVQISNSDDYRIQPQYLGPCLLVSKLWYNTLSPLLWYLYDTDLTTKDIPLSIIASFSPHIRILRTIPRRFWPFQCTQLNELVLRRDVDALYNIRGRVCDPDALETERRMIRTNLGLRVLDWTSPFIQTSILDASDFAQLSLLESLSLSFWETVSGELGRVLQATAETLRKLQIGYVDGMNGGIDAYFTRDMISRSLVLPKLESFKLTTNIAERCLEIVRCCPNLTTFNGYIGGGWNDDFHRLAKDLCDFCPKLTTLVLEQDGGEAVDIIVGACSSGNTLSRIKITMSGVRPDTGSAIAHHASTLKDLIIVNSADSRSWPGAFVPLVGCRGLKSFHYISHDTPLSNYLVLRQILVETWNCHELEVLELDIPVKHDEYRYDRDGVEQGQLDEEWFPVDCISQVVDCWFFHP